jgi:hypothetical protein
MRNVHERRIAAPAEEVGQLLDRMGGPHDRLWPAQDWMPMTLDQPLRVGSRGGHADIRYEGAAWEPGRRIELTFTPPTQLRGWHSLEVEALPDGSCLLRHVLVGQPTGSMRLLMPLVVRWIHDAVLEDLLDRAEQAVGTSPASPAQWSPWVRLLRRAVGMSAQRHRASAVAVPPGLVAAAGLPRPDFADAFVVRLPADSQLDVTAAHAALVAAGSPAWLDQLVRIRRALARALRLETAEWEPGTSPFQLLRQTDDVIVAGADDRHLDFRAVLQVRERPGGGSELLLCTVVQRHNLVGRAYFALVKPFHRRVVPAMLRRAAARALVPVG